MKRLRAAGIVDNGVDRLTVALVTARLRGVLGIRELKPAIGDGGEGRRRSHGGVFDVLIHNIKAHWATN